MQEQGWFDGGCEPSVNGQATYGAIVKDSEGRTLFAESGYVGVGAEMSCNVAEYAGAIAVMKFFIENRIRRGVIYGDSKLVVKQMNRTWKAKRGLYMESYKEASQLKRQLPEVRFEWIPRERNWEADALARKAVRTTITTTRQRRELIRLIKQQNIDDRETKKKTF